MKKHPPLKQAIAAALLAAAALVGLTAGTANAKPREANCAAIAQAADSAIHAANVARQQGDHADAADWDRIADRALDNLHRKCMS